MSIKKEIIDHMVQHYQSRLRNVAWEIYRITNSDDLNVLANDLELIAKEMRKSAESWRLGHEKPCL